MTGDSKHTILIVDDENINRKVLGTLLDSMGYAYLEADSGAMGLSLLGPKVDLVLLDIMMPEMDGFETCRRLKEDAATRDIPVIFLSALNDTESKVKAFSMGGVDYVTKPFQFSEVKTRVETHISLRRSQTLLKRQNQHLEEMIQEKVREISESQLATIF
ncbi:MAG: response regulator, partial [Proteobacteria bacterium]|nr:response regulator [Pseudomonadota bacterium]